MKKEDTRPPGKTTIATDVLLTIARLTALQVPGVSHMSQVPVDFSRILHPRHHEEGVSVEVVGQSVNIDLYLVLEPNINMRSTSRQIQEEVARAVSEMVGMEAGRIDVHIEDVFYPPEED